jgi:hypothetical protein
MSGNGALCGVFENKCEYLSLNLGSEVRKPADPSFGRFACSFEFARFCCDVEEKLPQS